MGDWKEHESDGQPEAFLTLFHCNQVDSTRGKMSEEIESVRIQVFGADPRHAELEAKQLREVLNQLNGAEVRFASPEAPRATEGAKGQALLTVDCRSGW